MRMVSYPFNFGKEPDLRLAEALHLQICLAARVRLPAPLLSAYAGSAAPLHVSTQDPLRPVSVLHVVPRPICHLKEFVATAQIGLHAASDCCRAGFTVSSSSCGQAWHLRGWRCRHSPGPPACWPCCCGAGDHPATCHWRWSCPHAAPGLPRQAALAGKGPLSTTHSPAWQSLSRGKMNTQAPLPAPELSTAVHLTCHMKGQGVTQTSKQKPWR